MAASNNPEEIIGTYKRMMNECQQLTQKMTEVRNCFMCMCTIPVNEPIK